LQLVQGIGWAGVVELGLLNPCEKAFNIDKPNDIPVPSHLEQGAIPSPLHLEQVEYRLPALSQASHPLKSS
jgi:hypothetical protein